MNVITITEYLSVLHFSWLVSIPKSFISSNPYSLIFGPLLYLAGVAASMIHPYVSFAIYLAIPVYFIFAENKS
jgi:hypothetical protein